MKKIVALLLMASVFPPRISAEDVLRIQTTPVASRSCVNHGCTCNPCMCGAYCRCGTTRSKNSEASGVVEKAYSMYMKGQTTRDVEKYLYPALKKFFKRYFAKLDLTDSAQEQIAHILQSYHDLFDIAPLSISEARLYEQELDDQMNAQLCVRSADAHELITAEEYRALRKSIKRELVEDPRFVHYKIFKQVTKKIKSDLQDFVSAFNEKLTECTQEDENQSILQILDMSDLVVHAMLAALQDL